MDTLDDLVNQVRLGKMVRVDEQGGRDLMVLLANKVIEEVPAVMVIQGHEVQPVVKETKDQKDPKDSKEIVDAMKLVLEVMKAEAAHQASLAQLDLLEETEDVAEMVTLDMMGEEANPASLEQAVFPELLARTVKLQTVIKAALMASAVLLVLLVPQVNEALTLKMALTAKMALLVVLVLADRLDLGEKKDRPVTPDHKETMVGMAKMDQMDLKVLLALLVTKVTLVAGVHLENGVKWVKLDMGVMAIPVHLATLALRATVARQEKKSMAEKDLLVSLAFGEDLELMVMLANLDQMGPAGILAHEEILEILVLQE